MLVVFWKENDFAGMSVSEIVHDGCPKVQGWSLDMATVGKGRSQNRMLCSNAQFVVASETGKHAPTNHKRIDSPHLPFWFDSKFID